MTAKLIEGFDPRQLSMHYGVHDTQYAELIVGPLPEGWGRAELVAAMDHFFKVADSHPAGVDCVITPQGGVPEWACRYFEEIMPRAEIRFDFR